MQTDVLHDLEEQLAQVIPCDIRCCDNAAEWLVKIRPPHRFENTTATRYCICNNCKRQYIHDLQTTFSVHWSRVVTFHKL